MKWFDFGYADLLEMASTLGMSIGSTLDMFRLIRPTLALAKLIDSTWVC